MRDLIDDIRYSARLSGWSPPDVADWNEPYTIPALIALTHRELSEALEAWRKDDREQFMTELADVCIYVLSIAGLDSGADFEAIIWRKLARNAERGFRHGGKRL